MDAKTRAEIRAACAAATPGPWDHDFNGGMRPTRAGAVALVPAVRATGRGGFTVCVIGADRKRPADGDNMEFIAGARQWVPALLDALEAAEARIAELESKRKSER